MHNLEFVVAGYLITGLALGGYVARLFVRARRARERAAAIAARRVR
jgi:CcmD family protein